MSYFNAHLRAEEKRFFGSFIPNLSSVMSDGLSIALLERISALTGDTGGGGESTS